MEPRRDRPAIGAPLGAFGRAERFAYGSDEIWTLPAGMGAVGRRLVSLGMTGVSGFEVWGEDEAGVFLVRRVPSATVASLARGARLAGPLALGKVLDLARALDACERAGVFPGPLAPVEVALGSAARPDAFILATRWVGALVGADPPGAATSAPLRWTPPEQQSGAPWDNAANRYVLGLVAYRLLSGRHPESGSALRDGAFVGGAPPPFAEDVARALAPGVQSLVLAMLALDPRDRPAIATVIARSQALLRGEILPSPPRAVRQAPPRPKAGPTVTVPRFRAFAPVAAGGVVLALAFLARSDPAPRVTTKPTLTSTTLARTSAETCAPCHARQVAEWQRSVMANAAKSPLFGALESVVEEQVGRDASCPAGAGVLRRAGADVCKDERTSRTVTGTGGEHWCINCHASAENLASAMPAWGTSRLPARDLLSPAAMEGISCAVCHQTVAPDHARRETAGNPSWISPITGDVFSMRPEDGQGRPGIANSGHHLDARSFLATALGTGVDGDPIVHRPATRETRDYLASSEFCGACHDVRLFGSDAIGARERGEHFKRLRNAYSEWRSWAETERAAGRTAATCQDCHMSLYPGVCVKGSGDAAGCPSGFHFEARAPGERARAFAASASVRATASTSHYFTSVDVPLAPSFPAAWIEDSTLDANGVPLGLDARREALLRRAFRFALEGGSRAAGHLEIPVAITNVGAGHRVPAGFSQEREIWVELTVRDARGRVVYEVGKIASNDGDLRDKVFTRVTTSDDSVDLRGRPQGVFGADVVDGPDAPRWTPSVAGFRGSGLVNLQNGFLRCVRCIGTIDRDGKCQPGPGQGTTRADRFDDGAYDLDTGECRSNLAGSNAFFETYFPVGALDARRGVAKAPDAIIDTRSAAPGVTQRYVYEIDTGAHAAPFRVEARLRFRPFPPFLVRAFAAYEADRAARGLRPSGAQVTPSMLRRIAPLDLAEATETIDR